MSSEEQWWLKEQEGSDGEPPAEEGHQDTPPPAHPLAMPNIRHDEDGAVEPAQPPTPTATPPAGFYVRLAEPGTPREDELLMHLRRPAVEFTRPNFAVMPPKQGLAEKVGMGGLANRLGLRRTEGGDPFTLEEYIEGHTDRLHDLCDQVPTLAVTVIATKSSAKTTTTAHTALLAAQFKATMAFDANPSGRFAQRLGLDLVDAFDMKDLANLVQAAEQTTKQQVAAIIGNRSLSAEQKAEQIVKITNGPKSARLDIGSVSSHINRRSNLNGIRFVPMAHRLNGEDAKRVMRASGQIAEYRFFDTGNVIDNPRTRPFLEGSDVVVFTANAAIKDSLPMLLDNMREMRELGFDDLVDHSVVVFSNLTGKERTTLGAVRLEHRRGNLCVVKHGYGSMDTKQDQEPHKGPLLGVPADPQIASDERYNLDDLDDRTYAAYQNVLIAILEERKRQLDKVA